MGTSRSHPGSGSGSPLIPAHADPADPTPSPEAPPQRFKAFRIRLGKFASTGSDHEMRAALRHFAAKSMGGSEAGARRFTAMAGVGADAFAASRAPGGLADALARSGVDLASLRDASVETVVEALAAAFASDDADRAKVEQALRDAFSEVAEEGEGLDVFGSLTEDQQVRWLANYLEGCVLQQLLDESGTAMDKAGTPAEAQAREDQLREAVQSAVGVHLQPAVSDGLAGFTTRDAVVAMEKAVIASVLRSWEDWDG